MVVPSPETAEAVPYAQQIATGAIIGLGSVALMAWRFVTGKKREPEAEEKKVLVDQGTAVDVKPFIDELVRIRQAVEGSRDDAHEMLKLAREEATNEEIERLAEERAERIMMRRRAEYEDRVQEDFGRRLAQMPSVKAPGT